MPVGKGRLPGGEETRRPFGGGPASLGGRIRGSEALGLSFTLVLAATLLAGSGFALLAARVAAQGAQPSVDQSVLDWLIGHRSQGLSSAMKIVTAMGSATVIVPLVAVAGLAWWRLGPATPGGWGRFRPVLLLAVSAAGGLVLSSVAKELVGRARPPVSVHLVSVASWSFPSGHATQAMAFYGCGAALTAAWVSGWRAKVAAWTVAALLIAAIGVSRLYLGVHWFTDVVGGYALGAVWLSLVLVITRVRDSTSRGLGWSYRLAGRDQGRRAG